MSPFSVNTGRDVYTIWDRLRKCGAPYDIEKQIKDKVALEMFGRERYIPITWETSRENILVDRKAHRVANKILTEYNNKKPVDVQSHIRNGCRVRPYKRRK